MRIFAAIPGLAAVLMTLCLQIGSAHAQATRTWVSGVGDDANPCSRTAPCKTWAGAISKTAAGGEIDNLDEGGFGAVTITKSLTIDGGGGGVASVLVSGTPGVTVAAGSNDVVILRNLQFQGLLGNGGSPGSAGTIGINFVSGAALMVEHCAIYGFGTNAISVTTSAPAKIDIRDTDIDNNIGGIQFAPTSTLTASLTRVSMYDNNYGVRAQDGSAVTIFQSVASNNTKNGYLALSATNPATINLINSVAANNGNSGVVTDGANATINLVNDVIANNVTGINTSLGGKVNGSSPGSTLNVGNTTPGSPNGTASSLQ